MNAPLSDLDSCANEPLRVPGAIQPHGCMRVPGVHGREDQAIVGFEPLAVDRDAQAPGLPPARHFLPQRQRDAGPASAEASCSVDRSA
jgi:hypothetical protein